MRTEQEMVAYALETDVALLPFIPELLADLEELGSDAELICSVIEDLPLPDDAEVMDLGSGKGAVAVEIALELGLGVVGVELFEPFVASSQQLAQARGVADRCRFVHGDVAKLAGTLPPVDVVVFAALGDVLGRLDETIGIIRQYVKPGGYVIVSDVFVADGGSTDFAGFEQYGDHAQTTKWLTAAGDRLVREVRDSGDEDEDADVDVDVDSEDELIAARADEIARRHPEVADAVRQFASSQKAENDYVSANLVDAVWVLQRS